MPRYYFDLYDGPREQDGVGTELSDHEAARQQAILFAGAILQDEPHQLSDRKSMRIGVRDGGHSPLFEVTITLSEGPSAS